MGSLVESLNLSNKYLEEINHSLFIYRLFSLKLSYSKQFPADGTEKSMTETHSVHQIGYSPVVGCFSLQAPQTKNKVHT